MTKKVKLYALSTCGWCRKTVDWLESNEVSCDKVYVDKLQGAERERILDEMKEHNPRTTFPTMVIGDGEKVIVGFKPEEFEEDLKS